MTSITGQLAALSTAVCWTATAIFFESAAKRMGSLALNFIRLVIAFAFLAACNAIFLGRAWPTDATAHVWFWLSLSGLVGFTLGDMCLFRSYVLIGSRTALLMMSLVPIFAAFIEFVSTGQRLTAWDTAGMTTTIGGIVLVLSEKKPDENGLLRHVSGWGISLAILASLCQAVGLVFSKIGLGSDYNAFAGTQIRVVAGVVGFAAIYTVIGWWPRVREGLRNRPAMTLTVFGAFTGPFLGVSMSLLAVQHSKAGVASAIMAITPILVIVPSHFAFKEKITPRAVAGACVAVAGVAILFAFA